LIDGRKTDIERAKEEKLIAYKEGVHYITTGKITEQMVQDFLRMAGLDENDPQLQKVARTLLPMSRISTPVIMQIHK
jgi:hypothetical protein